MDYETIILERERHITWIKLNRPETRNAQNAQMRRELVEAFREINDDKDVRVAVLTGVGEVFSSGRDIKEGVAWQGKESPIEEWERRRDLACFTFIRETERPVIAMVNGYALAQGCEMLLACDIRIASENAKFGITEINVGTFPGSGSTFLLAEQIGWARTMEMILTGDLINAHEAERIGLVNHVVPHDKLESTVRELAEKIASKSPLATRFAKIAMTQLEQQRLNMRTSVALNNALRMVLSTSRDYKEGKEAWTEKRAPAWEDR